MTGLLTAVGEVIWSLALLLFAIGFLCLVAPMRKLIASLALLDAARRVRRAIQIIHDAASKEGSSEAVLEPPSKKLAGGTNPESSR
jgi:hypothetical protein